MNAFTHILHDITHRVPGIPEHSDTANTRSRQRAKRAHGTRHQGRALRSPNNHHQNPPRILDGWQNRIAHFVHVDR